MNFRQRRTHKYIWVVLVLLMPILFALAIWDLSYGPEEQNIAMETKEKGTSLVIENEWLRTAIVTTTGKSSLNLVLKEPLKHPSALVYTMNKSGEKEQLLGQLTGTGEYYFPIPNRIHGILLFDPIKEFEIEKLVFSWD